MLEQWTAAWRERHAARVAAWRAGGRAYTGRFAPSPTGPLHAGSLLAALASFLDARAHGGRWLVRMEDLDPPRTVHGAAEDILATLAACGLVWDDEVMVQSTRGAAYQAAFDRLAAQGRVYACACTRREIADSVTNLRQHRFGRELVYPGTCRAGIAPGRAPRAWRLRVNNAANSFSDAFQAGAANSFSGTFQAGATISFTDVFQGPQHQDLAAEVGDFVLKRADGLWAYQLAVVVDDAKQGVTHVVRGADLLDSTPRQILLQQLLGYPTPEYAHIGVLADAAGEKLSKQTGAPAVNPRNAAAALAEAARFLFSPHA